MVFLDEVIVKAGTQDPSVGEEVHLNDERGAYLVDTSERSTTH